MNKIYQTPSALNTIPIFFCADMLSDPGSFSPSAGKPKLALDSWEQLGMAIDVRVPLPVTLADLERAHASDFVRDVLALDTPNGFGTCDEKVARSLPWTSGAMLCAAREAIANRRVAVAPVSGFHHAGHGYAGGYCTFNGLMVTATALLVEGRAKKVGILDFDQHWGNGTQDIIATLGLESVVEHYSPVREFSKKSRAQAFLQAIPAIVAKFQTCDVILYQAGADPHVDDPLGGWLTTEQLFERDRLVFEAAAALGLPIAWNLAGGYQTPVSRVLDIHDNTMRACAATFLVEPVVTEVQTILEVGGEGGGLTIIGIKKYGQWMFQAATNEALLSEYFYENANENPSEDAVREPQRWVTSLSKVLSKIEYAWNCLFPIEMHPEFATEIFKLKLEQDATGRFYDRVKDEWERCVANALNPQSPQNGFVEQRNADLGELDSEDGDDNKIDMRSPK